MIKFAPYLLSVPTAPWRVGAAIRLYFEGTTSTTGSAAVAAAKTKKRLQSRAAYIREALNLSVPYKIMKNVKYRLCRRSDGASYFVSKPC